MMTRLLLRRAPAILAVALAGLLLPTSAAEPAVATTEPGCDVGWGSLPRGDGALGSGSLLDVRSGRHRCFDRLVLDIGRTGAAYSEVSYVDQIRRADGGAPIPVRGGAVLQILLVVDVDTPPVFHPTDADEVVDVSGYDTFRQVVLDGAGEGTLGLTQMGLGVRARLPFRVLTLPGPDGGSRVVVDVAHHWPSGPVDDLPGDPVEVTEPIGELMVVGVAADDVLNVRHRPGVGQPVLTTLAPGETGIFFAGRARRIGGSIWYEIWIGRQRGWANSRYLVELVVEPGTTSDGHPTGG